jgi:hypothetical protein
LKEIENALADLASGVRSSGSRPPSSMWKGLAAVRLLPATGMWFFRLLSRLDHTGQRRQPSGRGGCQGNHRARRFDYFRRIGAPFGRQGPGQVGGAGLARGDKIAAVPDIDSGHERTFVIRFSLEAKEMSG